MSTGWPLSLASTLNETDDWEDAFERWCRDEDAPKIDFYEWTDHPAEWELEFDEQCGEDDDDAYCWNEYQPRPLSLEIDFDSDPGLDFDGEDLEDEDGENTVFHHRDWFSPAGAEEGYKIQLSDDTTSTMITIVPASAKIDSSSDNTESAPNLQHRQSESSTESSISKQPKLTEKNLNQHDEQMPSQDSHNAISSIFDAINQLEALNERMNTKLALTNQQMGNEEQ
ncbi:uncharacterized protein IWZ02DRAFT_488626 [Phyllosticta citriasiana]|uniref:uncharacterized protein n=1 Tax=Phyllosticta citriasiana TaxID=595635 RepID=UPI0030FDA9D3